MQFNYCHRIFHNIFVILLCCSPILCSNLQAEDINAQLESTIESYMDVTAKPCYDFHSYACGNWVDQNKYDYETQIGDVITVLHHQYDEKLKQILEGGISSNKIATQTIFNKVRDFYETCKKLGYSDSHNFHSYVKPTADDGWPYDGGSWNPKEKWNVWSTMGRLAAIGYNHLFFQFDLNQQADSSYAPHFYPYELDYPQLGTYNDGYFYSSDPEVHDMTGKMINFTQQLATLYTEFANKTVPAVEMTVSEYQQESRTIDIFSYLSAYLGDQDVANITIIIHNIEYLRKLADVIDGTPDNVLIHTLKKSFRFYMAYLMPGEEWKTSCVYITRKMVPLAMDYLYDQEVYKAEGKATSAVIEKVFKSMQQKFVALTEQHSDELTAEETECLRGKILNMKLSIGNLPQSIDDNIYVDYFRSWKVTKGDFYGNIVNALTHKYRDSHELLKRKEFSPLRSLSHRVTTVPFYQASSNAVVIPFAYIRYPVIQPGFHELFQYAELGNSIGHEMLHGSDARRLYYDEEGKPLLLKVNDNPKSVAALGCLKQDSTSSLNGTLANLSGFRLAYDTYFQQSEVPQYLAKSKLNNKQFYFVKFAQMFCANPYIIDNGSRIWPSTLVTPIVENNPEFDKVFSCHPVGNNFARLG